MTELPARVEVPAEVVWQKVEGRIVFLELDGGRYYALDDVGTRMWELLQEGDVSDAPARLLEMYDVDEATLRRDLAELIGKLVDADLLRIPA